MILLLAADRDDALRCRAGAETDEPVVWVVSAADVRADVINPGARVVRTNRWQHDERIISALQVLHARIGLVDPTGLLGPIDRREGARSTKPWGSPPVGGSFEADTRSVAMRRRAGGA